MWRVLSSSILSQFFFPFLFFFWGGGGIFRTSSSWTYMVKVKCMACRLRELHKGVSQFETEQKKATVSSVFNFRPLEELSNVAEHRCYRCKEKEESLHWSRVGADDSSDNFIRYDINICHQYNYVFNLYFVHTIDCLSFEILISAMDSSAVWIYKIK